MSTPKMIESMLTDVMGGISDIREQIARKTNSSNSDSIVAMLDEASELFDAIESSIEELYDEQIDEDVDSDEDE